MEPYEETRLVRYECKSMDLEAARRKLQETNEQLRREKDELMQSYLDSRPLIDELEKQKSSLAATKNRIAISTVAISGLESQIKDTNIEINSKKMDELKARTTINEINLALDRTREEMERIKLEKDEDRRARSELKQVLRLRKQSLRVLQLEIRAVRLESEAFGSSAAEALRFIKNPKMDNSTVQITQEEFYALARRAEEETALADWRVSVSMEQKIAAEASRDSALRRLKELHAESKSRKRRMKMKEKLAVNIARDSDDQPDFGLGMGTRVNNREIDLAEVQAKVIPESSKVNPPKEFRRSRSNKKKIIKAKKASIFARIRTFLVQKITRLFR